VYDKVRRTIKKFCRSLSRSPFNSSQKHTKLSNLVVAYRGKIIASEAAPFCPALSNFKISLTQGCGSSRIFFACFQLRIKLVTSKYTSASSFFCQSAFASTSIVELKLYHYEQIEKSYTSLEDTFDRNVFPLTLLVLFYLQ